MTKQELNKINILALDKKARYFFEATDDPEFMFMMFGDCKTIEEINKVGIEAYNELILEIDGE